MKVTVQKGTCRVTFFVFPSLKIIGDECGDPGFLFLGDSRVRQISEFMHLKRATKRIRNTVE